MITAGDPRTDAERSGLSVQRSAPPLQAVHSEPDPDQDLAAEISLFQRVAQDDRESFELLHDRFSGTLFSVAYRVLKDRHAAEDTLQEAFVHIWRKASSYNPTGGKPIAWAATLTRNKAIDRLRVTQRHSRLRDDVQRETEIAAQFEDRSSMEAVASAETGVLVRAAIGELSKEQREAIELAFYSSLTQCEIANRLNQPLGTIKARIRRGMNKLKKALRPHFGPARVTLRSVN